MPDQPTSPLPSANSQNGWIVPQGMLDQSAEIERLKAELTAVTAERDRLEKEFTDAVRYAESRARKILGRAEPDTRSFGLMMDDISERMASERDKAQATLNAARERIEILDRVVETACRVIKTIGPDCPIQYGWSREAKQYVYHIHPGKPKRSWETSNIFSPSLRKAVEFLSAIEACEAKGGG